MRPARATKTSKPVTKQAGATTTSSQDRRRDPMTGQSKHTKEAFMKKLALCSKTFDYKDETKDVKAKSERLAAITELQQMLQD